MTNRASAVAPVVLTTLLLGLPVLAGVAIDESPPALDEDEPVARVVADDRLDAVGAIGRLRDELDALRHELVEGPLAVVGRETDGVEGALVEGPPT